jgi:hypothetical protein
MTNYRRACTIASNRTSSFCNDVTYFDQKWQAGIGHPSCYSSSTLVMRKPLPRVMTIENEISADWSNEAQDHNILQAECQYGVFPVHFRSIHGEYV